MSSAGAFSWTYGLQGVLKDRTVNERLDVAVPKT